MARNISSIRCVNLDWLEVFAREPAGAKLDSFFYREQNWYVKEREYGTRVYREMFSLCDNIGNVLLEIRRNPFSGGKVGIHDDNECHIRLHNRTCYFDNAAIFLNSFLTKYQYTDVRISRVDVCLDFSVFDYGDEPQAFVRRYFKHVYAKINQGNISSHGADTWSGQDWNSISWGSKSSMVSTKMYNKTKELYDAKQGKFGKPYIREAWFRCGLIDDILKVTKDGEKVDIWRVEFSMKSSVKNWIPIELDGKDKNYYSMKNTLDVYDGREKLLVIFASLAQHYFRFKKFVEGVRKDRCPDKLLFDFSGVQTLYKIGKPDTALGTGELDSYAYQKLQTLVEDYKFRHNGKKLHEACDILLNDLQERIMRSQLEDPWRRQELEELKLLLTLRFNDKSLTYDAAMQEVQRLLAINKKVISNL